LYVMLMKTIVPLILFLAISAFSEKQLWTDENGGSYCYGHHMNGICGQKGKVVSVSPNVYPYIFPDFHVRKLNDNYFQTDHSSVKFLCDFIQFDYKKSLVKVLDTGVCPVQEKAGFNRLNQPVQFFYNLYITKQKKSFDVKTEELYSQVQQSQILYKRNFFRKDFFTLGDCSNSNCEILNYIDKQPQDFDIKCDFVKKKDGQVGKVQVVGEGVCPIEITGKNNEKQVYYVRSVKDGDAYRLLMTNKRK